jgi:GNAT superfamily N-acetyltransferase
MYAPDGLSLETLYVMPEFWNRGVGSRLHDLALDRLRETNFEEASLWTLAENHRARTFYEKRGWSLTGPTRVVPSRPYPIDVEYARSTARN